MGQDDSGTEGPLGILCGGGSIPLAVADGGRSAAGVGSCCSRLRGFADPQRVAGYPHCWIAFGQVGCFCRSPDAEGCRDLVWSVASVRPGDCGNCGSTGTPWSRCRASSARFRGGDDHLLSGPRAASSRRTDFACSAAHEVAPDIRCRRARSAAQPADRGGRRRHRTRLGVDALRIETVRCRPGRCHRKRPRAGGRSDGRHRRNAARIADLREAGRIRLAPRARACSSRRRRPARSDASICRRSGPRRCSMRSQARLAGIAVVAGGTIVAEPERLVEAADRNGLFVVGVRSRGGRRRRCHRRQISARTLRSTYSSSRGRNPATGWARR